MAFDNGFVFAVSVSSTHTFSKMNRESITLLTGLGVEGDAHLGKTVKHRSRVAADPTQPNLRQVHLIHSELLDELRLKGFNVSPCVDHVFKGVFNIRPVVISNAIKNIVMKSPLSIQSMLSKYAFSSSPDPFYSSL